MARSTTGKYGTAIRFPPEMYERLRQAADERDLPINWLVVRAVAEMLDNLLPPDQIRLTRNGDSA